MPVKQGLAVGDLASVRAKPNTAHKAWPASGPLQLLFLLLPGSHPHFVQVPMQTLQLRNLSPDDSVKNNPPSSPFSLLTCMVFIHSIYKYIYSVSSIV